MLKSLLLVWVLSFNLADTELAYQTYLGYTSGEHGYVTPELSEALSRPELTGRPFITMYPPSGPKVGLRFIESEPTAFYPMKRLGWSAIEILVADTKRLANELDNSPFQRLAGPDFLTSAKNILAMQSLGPSSELLYLTHIIDPSKSFLVIPKAPTPVGHTFIMVLGTQDLIGSMNFFETHFDNPVKGPMPFKVEVLSDAYDLPSDYLHDLALVTFADGFAFELDQYPESANPIPAEHDQRGGVVLVTASYDPSKLKHPLPWRTESGEGAKADQGIIILPSGAPLQLVPEVGIEETTIQKY